MYCHYQILCNQCTILVFLIIKSSTKIKIQFFFIVFPPLFFVYHFLLYVLSMNLHLNSIILLLLLFISCCSGLNAKVISGAPKQKPKVETPSTTTTTETVRTTPPASSTSSTTSSSSNSLRQPNEPSGIFSHHQND